MNLKYMKVSLFEMSYKKDAPVYGIYRDAPVYGIYTDLYHDLYIYIYCNIFLL